MSRNRGFAMGLFTAASIVCVCALGAAAYFGGLTDIKNRIVQTAEASDNTIKETDTKNTDGKDYEEVSANDGLKETALFTYEFYNETTEATDSLQGECPIELVGKNMSDVKAYYSDWQVMSFSPNNVLLRKIIGVNDDERYVVGVYDDYVAVFYENTEDGIYMMTDIPISGLEHDKQVMLNDGIYVEGKDRLRRILEDYSS
ncbi:hypothetical protein SDC9_94154 [bioreactor metagenome]|uniref:Bypass of forespore C C-terminal domain-containing protein n=1 Tax=bioreactor metagenome TaxID=1076179 RepID=A0A645ACN6_9ZZZZ|nr:hypothetical protein [Candidatus Metalachnospira sp.]